MFHNNREVNNKIINLHEKKRESTFNEHISKDNSVYINYHNLQTLAIAKCKANLQETTERKQGSILSSEI